MKIRSLVGILAITCLLSIGASILIRSSRSFFTFVESTTHDHIGVSATLDVRLVTLELVAETFLLFSLNKSEAVVPLIAPAGESPDEKSEVRLFVSTGEHK